MGVRTWRLLPLLLLAAVTAGAGPGAGRPAAKLQGQAVTTVLVTLRDFRFVLSRTQVPVGLVRFVVVNRGATVHDLAVAGRKTRLLEPGERAVLLVRLGGAARQRYVCTVPGHEALGMKGVLLVAAPGGVVPVSRGTGHGRVDTEPPDESAARVELTRVGLFDRPVHVTAPPGDPRRLFIVEQRGFVRVLLDGELLPEPFLDISDRVKIVSESGLLSLAFAPDYETSGRFYIHFTNRVGNGNVNVMEFRRSAQNPNVADPESGRLLLDVFKPWENHNGGMLQFGPDGYLYVSIGDGDSGVLNRPGAFAQTLDDLLGNILRIDPAPTETEPYTVPDSNPFVGAQGARPEVWAYGLRNPWRFWVDRVTGDLYVGDVGEGNAEEIDLQPAGEGGANFGWPCFEGSLPFDTAATCPSALPPLLEYSHAGGACSVVAGLVLHDPLLPLLEGRLLYADVCRGSLKTLAAVAGRLAEEQELGVQVVQPVSFGEDALGRAYVATLGGAVYRIDPAPAPATNAASTVSQPPS